MVRLLSVGSMADLRDQNSLAGRVKRYARVSTAVGGVASRFLGARILGMEQDRGEVAAELGRILGGLKGPVMKVAQMLATIPDALPSEYVAAFAQLQANAPSMGWPFVKRRMATELGARWLNRFESFDGEAAAAASLGQVHKAIAVDGRMLACKLQYPDMGSVIEADLRQLRLAFAVFERYDKAIDSSQIQIEIGERLREELDYRLEARHIELFRHMLAGEDGVHVPDVVDDLSTDRLLTMTWLEGRPLLDYKDEPLEIRNRLAALLFRAWYVPFHHYGIIHGDPHLGNYTVSDSLDLNLLDYGCVRIFPPQFVHGVIDLYHALERGDRGLAVHAYESWGFKNLSNEIIDALNLWAEFAYAPLLDDRTRRIQETGISGIYGREVAEKVHKRLRELGPVTPPREFVFMDRAAIGLGGVFLHLGAELNWHRMFEALIEGSDQDKMTERQHAALKSSGITAI